jgi:hypothetical protein
MNEWIHIQARWRRDARCQRGVGMSRVYLVGDGEKRPANRTGIIWRHPPRTMRGECMGPREPWGRRRSAIRERQEGARAIAPEACDTHNRPVKIEQEGACVVTGEEEGERGGSEEAGGAAADWRAMGFREGEETGEGRECLYRPSKASVSKGATL